MGCMNYVPFGKLGFDVSRLGFGCMRLPTRMEGDKKVIDREEAVRMIRRAIDAGVTYIDTAYGYHGGESETVVGLALRDGYREKVTLTTKLPYWAVEEKGDLDKVLDLQLKRLGLPGVDFYILHAMRRDAYAKLDALDFKGFYARALRDGRIRHTGFSFHDDYAAFLRILGDYPFDMAQVQFNYLDVDHQAGLKGVEEAGKRGTAVVVMEPLRGGALANPPKELKTLIAQNARGWSPAEWALRYVGDRKEVVTILSGMSEMSQVEDNLRIFSADDFKPGMFDGADAAFAGLLRAEYKKRVPIGCTGCEYCLPCPRGVAIPRLFHDYNEAKMLGREKDFIGDYKAALDKEHDAGRCVRCGRCEGLCPQHLPIMTWLKTLRNEYEASL